jgi:hypothetical protein
LDPGRGWLEFSYELGHRTFLGKASVRGRWLKVLKRVIRGGSLRRARGSGSKEFFTG